MWLYVILVAAILLLLYRFLNKAVPSSGGDPNVRNIKGVVAKVEDLKVGEMKECALGQSKILLFRKEERKFFATATKCGHMGMSLSVGTFCDGRIRCPAHGACFNVENGDIEDYPGTDPIPSYNVTLNGDDVVVSAPSSLLGSSKMPKVLKKRDKKNEKLIVIIGGGCAGSTCAEVLRQEGWTGRIVVLSREQHIGYDRTRLSKNLNIPLDKIFLRSKEFYEKNDIEFLTGVEVTQLDPETKTITTKNGDKFVYDKCLISPGADPQRLKFIPGNDGKNIYPLRNVEEAHTINSIVEGKDVLIVGSSFIGMEVTSCIINKAKSVTVIGMEKVPFERVLGFEIGNILQKMHEKNNVKFIMEAVVQEFVKDENGVVGKVILKDNKGTLPCDVIILGAGALPATGFIPKDKLNVERDGSINVDEYLYTGKDGLYCGGDIARYPWKYLPGMTIRIEHWGMAQIQGQIVAINMIKGNVKKCENIPYFWTTQFQKSIKYAGHALKYDKIIMDNGGDDLQAEPKFAAYYILNGKAIAICTMNRDPQAAQFAELLNAGIQITEEEINESLLKSKSTVELTKELVKRVNTTKK